MNEPQKTVKVCLGHNCKHLGKHIMTRLESDLVRKPEKKVELGECQCRGRCAEGPIVVTEKNGKTEIHKKMDPIKASKLI